MARSLQDKLATLEPTRREAIEVEAERLHTAYLTLQELRKAKALTQVQLAETLGIQQATVAKYERQGDLLLSTLQSYVRAMGGTLDLVVTFPGKAPVALEGLGDTEASKTRRRRARDGRRTAASA